MARAAPRARVQVQEHGWACRGAQVLHGAAQPARRACCSIPPRHRGRHRGRHPPRQSVSRRVVAHRARLVRRHQPCGGGGAWAERAARARAGGWHTLHTPPWVPPSEADALARRVADWADALCRSGVDVGGVAAVLGAPLVPRWVSRAGVARSPRAPPLPHTPLLLVSASDPASTRARVSGPGYDHWFDYVPGGGDDEEAWAGGLRVRVFWAHRHALLAGGPAGWGTAVAAVAAASQAVVPSVGATWHAVCGTGVAVAHRGGAAAAVASGAAIVHLLPRAEDALGEASDMYVPLVVRPNSRHHDVLAACSPAVAAVSAALVRTSPPPPSTPPSTIIVIVADDGGDVTTASCSTAVALAAAALLACFSPPPACLFVSPFGATHRRPCGCAAPPPASKDAVRDRVAAVAACVPGAAPSRDAVKGVWHWVAPVPGRRCVACGQ